MYLSSLGIIGIQDLPFFICIIALIFNLVKTKTTKRFGNEKKRLNMVGFSVRLDFARLSIDCSRMIVVLL
jgi:hypothetical protein